MCIVLYFYKVIFAKIIAFFIVNVKKSLQNKRLSRRKRAMRKHSNSLRKCAGLPASVIQPKHP